MDGLELAALDTVQHGLAGDAEQAHGVDDGHEACGCLAGEAGAQRIGDHDTPRRARGDLLPGDESVVELAVQRRWGHIEDGGGLVDGQRLAGERLRWWDEASNFSMGA